MSWICWCIHDLLHPFLTLNLELSFRLDFWTSGSQAPDSMKLVDPHVLITFFMTLHNMMISIATTLELRSFSMDTICRDSGFDMLLVSLKDLKILEVWFIDLYCHQSSGWPSRQPLMAPSTSRTAYPSNRIIVTESLVEPILRLLEQNCKANTAKLQYDRPEMVHPFTTNCELQWIQCPPGHHKIWGFRFPTFNWSPSYINLPQLQTQKRQKLLAMIPFPRHFLHL